MSRILIVDDDKDLTQALSVRLEDASFEVAVANSADEASQQALRFRPDVIVLDIDMPHYTGPEFHHCLQFAKRARSIPVIYLSGHSTDSNRREAFAQGAKAFIAKPYDLGHLVETLHDVIEDARALEPACAEMSGKP